MNNLYYQLHLILNSKYYLAYKLIILFFIYLLISTKSLVLCMNENINTLDMPCAAEAKSAVKPSEQVIALHRNIQAYAGSIASQLESRDQIIEESKQEIAQLAQQIDQQGVEIQTLRTHMHALVNSIRASNHEIVTQKIEIKNLVKSIEGHTPWNGARVEGYKDKIFNLGKEINELRRELEISQTLLAEAKADKDKMFEIFGRARDREK